MVGSDDFDAKNLRTQLENYELIVDVHVEQLDEPVKEQLASKLALAESYLSESSRWEKLGEKQKYDEALYNAKKVLGEIKVIIHQIIGQDMSPEEGDEQSP